MKISKQLRARWRTLRQPKYRWIWCLVAAGIYGLILALPLAGFTPEGKLSLAVFGVTAFLSGTSTLPLAVTGLIVLFLISVSGALDHSATYSYFGNRAVFFILGAFILASPIMRSGLSTRLALAVVSRFGYNQNALIGSILGLAAFLALAWGYGYSPGWGEGCFGFRDFAANHRIGYHFLPVGDLVSTFGDTVVVGCLWFVIADR